MLFSQQKTSLKNSLNNLSTKFEITFSYREKLILKFEEVAWSKEKTLEDIINQLSIQTGLVFSKVDAKHYVIRERSKQTRSICGQVFDQEVKEPISYVNIYFEGKNIYTNQQGNFVIDKLLKDGVVTITALGYESQKILVSSFKEECHKIFLKESINKLSEVIITDYLTRGFSKKKDGSIELTPQKMGVLPGVIEPDVLQTLQLIPGVQSPNETASGIHIRGGTPDQNLVIIDGVKMYHFSHFFGLISAFNPYITSDVKLYRSGTHAKYGNNAGGVLDIKTDGNIIDKFTAGFGTTFTHSDAYLKTPLFNKKVGVILSARRSITDIINSITYQQYSDIVFQNNKIAEGLDTGNSKIINAKNDFFYEDYYAKIIFEPNKTNKFSINTIYNANDLFFKGLTPIVLNQKEFTDVLVTKNLGLGADWLHGNLKKGLSKFSAYITKYNKRYDGLIEQASTGQMGGSYRENLVTENNFSYFYKKQTRKLNLWELGYQFNNFDVFYDYTRDLISEDRIDTESAPVGGKTYNHAVFTEYQLKQKKWLASLGVRWQFFRNANKGFLEPRLNLTYKFNRFFNIKGSSELKHQSIFQVEDFRQGALKGLFNRFWTISQGEKYPVLKSFQNSLGVNYQRKGWTLDAEVYYKYLDGIQFLFDENTRDKKNFSGVNVVKGLDVLLKKQWKSYGTWVTYSLSKSQYLFDEFNNGQQFDGSFDTPHNLIWSHHYTYKNFEASLGWRYRSGVPYTNKTSEPSEETEGVIRIVFDDLNTKRLPDYQRLDFTTSYKFAINTKHNIKGRIGLTLQNLLNKRNILFRDFTIENETVGMGINRSDIQVLKQTDTYSLGFVPNMVLRISF